MYIEGLDYGVTIDSHETVNYFRNFPDRGSIGYFSYEDAEADRNPLGNVEKYLDIIEDFISAGLIGDHYIFTDGQVSEIISEYEEWDWTPETGIVPWNAGIDPEPEPEYPNRKQRRTRRRIQNHAHKQSDRAHGKKRMPSAKFVRESDKQNMYHSHAKFVWHENHKGRQIPRTIRKHNKFREERFMPSPDWNGNPDPYMFPERIMIERRREKVQRQLNLAKDDKEKILDAEYYLYYHCPSRLASTRRKLKEELTAVDRRITRLEKAMAKIPPKP